MTTNDHHSSRGRRLAYGAGLLAAGTMVGSVLAGTLSASAATTASSTPTTSTPSTAAGAATSSSAPAATSHTPPKGPGGATPVRSDEKSVSASVAATLKAEALKAVPGGTVFRVETDAGDGAYEAHMTKADGTLVTVKFDKNLAVIKVEQGMGQGDPRLSGMPAAPAGSGMPGGPGSA
jgi:hypothetical protein